MSPPVIVRRRVRLMWSFLPCIAKAGAIFIGPAGEVVRIREDGGADRVLQGGCPHGGIAEDPSAGRAP